MAPMSRMPDNTLPACILAGGRSSRFPGDKSLVPIDGVPQLQRLVQQLTCQKHRVFVLADRSGRFAELGIDCEVDIYPNCGPMGGLATGLEVRLRRYGSGWLLVMGCDQLLFRPEWLSGLSELEAMSPSSLPQPESLSYLAAVWTSPFDTSHSHVNPFPGLYHTQLLPFLRDYCAQGKLSMREMLNEQWNRVFFHVQVEQPRDFSFNSPEQLRILLQVHKPNSEL